MRGHRFVSHKQSFFATGPLLVTGSFCTKKPVTTAVTVFCTNNFIPAAGHRLFFPHITCDRGAAMVPQASKLVTTVGHRFYFAPPTCYPNCSFQSCLGIWLDDTIHSVLATALSLWLVVMSKRRQALAVGPSIAFSRPEKVSTGLFFNSVEKQDYRTDLSQQC